MEAGRELDVKVAEALGWQVVYYNGIPNVWVGGTDNSSGENKGLLPQFSTTWGSMGVLVEEAKKQGIYLEYSHSLNGGYYGGAYSFDDGEYQMDYSTEQALPTAPHAVALVYLMARGVISHA
ncbi:hypothetical protein [Brevibacillus sp. 1238]|uniref:hypothetical protein n=1 Tax=Brevibacillus sp. 1238 TaxID=2940565 RepID=UPI0024756C44|nr:hypothetical protein [Brevibacillus sp. 1238]MDH6351906.1 hypothetical protein [Brevibacillus sp. 1238]